MALILTHHRCWLTFLASCCLVAALPASAQDLKCFILTPPEQILPGVKRLAITDFSAISGYKLDEQRNKTAMLIGATQNKDRFADTGHRLSDMIIAALLEKDRGVREVSSGFAGLGKKEGKSFQDGAFTNIFTVVERNELQRIMNELALGQSGVINDSAATQVGKILGVEAVVVGTANVDCEEKWLREERKDDGHKKQVDCEHLTTSASATIRIVRVETGQVIGSKDSRRVHEQKGCRLENFYDPSKSSGKGKSLTGLGRSLYGRGAGTIDVNKVTTPEISVDKCLAEIVTELVDYFAPSFKEQKLEFTKIEGDQFKRMAETAKDALKNASHENLNIAYIQYATIVEQDPYNHAAQFNLGVLYEAVGNYKQAKEKYDLAYSLKSEEDKYREARERLAKQVEYGETLNALGLVLQAHDFQVSSPEIAATTLSRIRTKGPGTIRHEIKAAPNDTSATVTRVPGEIELTMLETVIGWYKIRLPDGKEGFLSQEKAKIMK